MSHSKSHDEDRLFADEVRRLTDGMPAGRQTEQFRRNMRGNLEALSGLRSALRASPAESAAPDGLWSRIVAEMQVPAPEETPAAPMVVGRVGFWSRGWVRTAAAFAAGVGAAVGVGVYLKAPDTANPPVEVVTGPGTGTVASSLPAADDLLTRMATVGRSQPHQGVIAFEQFTPDNVTAAPVRRETKLTYVAADRWQAETAGAVTIRNGIWQFQTADAGKPAGEVKFNRVRADELARTPADELNLDAAALGRNYKLAVADGGAVAGRPTWLLTAEPNRAGRPSLKMWIDRETAVRLGSERLDPAQRVTARARFREFAAVEGVVAAPVALSDQGLAPAPADPNTEFQPMRDRARLGFEPLTAGEMPDGFALRRTILLNAAAGGRAALRTVFSDGLASVEIFQRPADGPADPSAHRRGRALELTETRDGVALRLVSEDLDLDALTRIAKGLKR